MSLWKCSNCGRRFDDDTAKRDGRHPEGWVIDACRVCAPDAEPDDPRDTHATGPDGEPA